MESKNKYEEHGSKLWTLKERRKLMEIRRNLVSKYYKQGFCIREICERIKKDLGLDTISTGTVHKDIQSLLKEWREERINDTDAAVQLELQRLDDLCTEAWQAWERSKEDYKNVQTRREGEAKGGKKSTEGTEIQTTKVVENSNMVVQYGDTRYLDVIHKALIERRKLMGLYAPEKKEVNGNMSFEQLLMETGVIDTEEEN